MGLAQVNASTVPARLISVEPQQYCSCSAVVTIGDESYSSFSFGFVRKGKPILFRERGPFPVTPCDEYCCNIVGFDSNPFEQVQEEIPTLTKEEYDAAVKELEDTYNNWGRCVDCN